VTPRAAIAITGIGAVTPVGATAIETAASLRAGICRFREGGLYIPLGDDDDAADGARARDVADGVTASVVAALPSEAAGAARVFELAMRATRDLLRERSHDPPRGRTVGTEAGPTGWFLALPEEDAVTASWGVAQSLGPALLDRVGDGASTVVAVRAQGGAGSLAVLGDAAAAIRGGTIARAVVVGVDTFIDRDRLSLVDRHLRIKSPRATAGMIPGEAATALVLESAVVAVRRRARVLATLGEVGTGDEPQTIGGDRESSGRGLTHALRAALAGGASHTPRWVLCDLNGEAYRAVEWGTVSVRLARELGPSARLTHPADGLGEIGAAIGGVLIAQALGGFACGYAPAPEALLWAGSDRGLRAAVRVLAPAPAGGVEA
jgi:3-oxoacyl-[acyl-carrier-protein] synthase I